MRARSVLLGVLGALGLACAWLLLAPVSIQPEAWDPGGNPYGGGVFAANEHLAHVRRTALEDGARGPEDVLVDPDETVTTGVEDGRILILHGGAQRTLADTGGRPFGLARDHKGGLWVADGRRGLLHVDHQGKVEVVSTEQGGVPFGFTDDVDMGPDGKVYFTDADARWGPDDLKLAALEAGPNGRLLRYDPETKQTELVLGGLYFANGVSVAPEGNYLLVCESTRMRVLKVWLRPERVGQTEVVVDHLPGFPDNVTSAGAGAYWIALYGPRSALKDRAFSSPWLRRIGARLPGPGLTRPGRHGMAVAVSHLGRVLAFLDDPAGGYAPVTTVQELHGKLFLGSLGEDAVGEVTAPLRRP